MLCVGPTILSPIAAMVFVWWFEYMTCVQGLAGPTKAICGNRNGIGPYIALELPTKYLH